MGVQLVPAGLLALGLPLLRESPTWLIKRGREAEARSSLSYLRMLPSDHPYIDDDVQFVKEPLRAQQLALGGDGSLKAFLKAAGREAATRGMWNRFVLVFLMFMWQAWSGAAAINYCTLT